MLFDSSACIVFLVLVVLLYWTLSFRKQNYLLLAASYFFYGWWDWRAAIGATLSRATQRVLLSRKSAEVVHMTTKSLRIALISHTFGEYCVQLANGLARYAEVLLMLPSEVAAPHRARLAHEVRLFTYPSPRFRQPILQFRMLRTIFRIIRDFGPDVIHYQGGHPWLDLTLPLLRTCPLVLTIHDVRPHPGDRLSKKTPLWLEKFVRNRTDRLIVQTEFARDAVIRDFPGAEKRISVIPHIQIGQKRASTSNRDDHPLVLFFGRIWEYKGLEYLIRAEPLITARVPDACILIAGHGEDFSRYSCMMVHSERFIVDNEFISEECATEYFARASVVVLPYIEASQSGVISMAYTAAKPVVASSVGGLPEMVEDGRTGYLVPPRDVPQLAGCISRLLLDHDLRLWMGANAKRKIEAECSPDVIAKRTIEVYLRAIEQGVQGRNRAWLCRPPTAPVSSASDAGGNDVEKQTGLRDQPQPSSANLR